MIALLSEEGYDGFEETDSGVRAYVGEGTFNSDQLTESLEPLGLNWTTRSIEKTNWNKEWEQNFQPVIVEDFCTVRADFHDIRIDTPYEIVITPKMSFGTGHHSTTQLMMRMMRDIDFKDRSVLDFGAGTGILAILAAMLGAQTVTAIDNDEWCYENAMENVQRNAAAQVEVALGTLEDVQQNNFDIILANINRHILLQYMPMLYGKIKEGGHILMSGLLIEDEAIIKQSATECGFRLKTMEVLNNWIAILFAK